MTRKRRSHLRGQSHADGARGALAMRDTGARGMVIFRARARLNYIISRDRAQPDKSPATGDRPRLVTQPPQTLRLRRGDRRDWAALFA
ncbi:jg22814 [Pararge aegeria aegeria]|uniref:Jg22814 protein n=1 Tax=Pararge aegeria aegeria TaxID=348720 RepID=A0A8S4RWZ7_9NEOP|nr:jg22814 [Pararge aegeria aegeria]